MKSIVDAKKQAHILSKKNGIQLKEALDLIAKENSFLNWKAYRDSLDTFWYEKSSPFLNHWFANHGEAEEYRNSYGGFLLTYKGQYFVAGDDYIKHLGLDPTDDIWKKINYDVSSANSFEKISKFVIKED